MKAIKIVGAVALLGTALSLSAFADEGMPEVKTANGVSYTSGGIGDVERDAMQQHAKDYNLRLTFAVNSGQYLADVKVSILNAKGRSVMAAVSDGPWFYAKLAPGKYTVKAEVDGKTQTRSITVGKNRTAVAAMIWASNGELTAESEV